MDTTPPVEVTSADLADRTQSPFQANKDVYPGISRDLTMDILSAYFYSLNENPNDGTDSDFPIKEEFVEPLFDLGDTVRVRGGPLDSWADRYEELEGYYSKQVFEIVGMWLKKASSPWGDGRFQSHDGDDNDEGDNDATPDGRHLQTRANPANFVDLYDATQHLLNDDSDVDSQAFDPLANDCWIYQLQLVYPTSSTTFPIPNVMLWNEENLVFDTDTMDGCFEDASGESDSDQDEAHAPECEAEDSSDTEAQDTPPGSDTTDLQD
ncbi:hypothetical protein DV736_g291, partial [Chaetothyriales sp. CBS 134916]